jgi:hypothetical protein
VTQRAALALLEAAAGADEVPAALVDDLIAAVLADPRVATALRAREATGPVRLMLALRLAAAVAHATAAILGEAL